MCKKKKKSLFSLQGSQSLQVPNAHGLFCNAGLLCIAFPNPAPKELSLYVSLKCSFARFWCRCFFARSRMLLPSLSEACFFSEGKKILWI